MVDHDGKVTAEAAGEAEESGELIDTKSEDEDGPENVVAFSDGKSKEPATCGSSGFQHEIEE